MNEEEIEKARQLRKDGLILRQIGEKLGFSTTTIFNATKGIESKLRWRV